MKKKLQNKKPFFSIIIPCLNEEKTLPNLLSDLEDQTFKDFEVIVVDAKSDDKTVANAKSFSKGFSKFQIITSSKRNVAHQRNLGSNLAQGVYIVFMDADVVIPNNFLGELCISLEKNQADIQTSLFSTDYPRLQENIAAGLTNILVILTNIIKNPIINESMLVVKRDCFRVLKGFDEKFHNDEGDNLVRRAKQTGMRYVLSRKPTYQFSYRRAWEHGFLKVGFNVLRIELMRILKIHMDWEKTEKLYPMQGGKDYSKKTL